MGFSRALSQCLTRKNIKLHRVSPHILTRTQKLMQNDGKYVAAWLKWRRDNSNGAQNSLDFPYLQVQSGYWQVLSVLVDCKGLIL